MFFPFDYESNEFVKKTFYRLKKLEFPSKVYQQRGYTASQYKILQLFISIVIFIFDDSIKILFYSISWYPFIFHSNIISSYFSQQDPLKPRGVRSVTKVTVCVTFRISDAKIKNKVSNWIHANFKLDVKKTYSNLVFLCKGFEYK